MNSKIIFLFSAVIFIALNVCEAATLEFNPEFSREKRQFGSNFNAGYIGGGQGGFDSGSGTFGGGYGGFGGYGGAGAGLGGFGGVSAGFGGYGEVGGGFGGLGGFGGGYGPRGSNVNSGYIGGRQGGFNSGSGPFLG